MLDSTAPRSVADYLAALDVESAPPSFVEWLCRFPANFLVLDFGHERPDYYIEDRYKPISDYPGWAVWVVAPPV